MTTFMERNRSVETRNGVAAAPATGAIKRVLDIVLATVLLVLAAPLIGILAIAVKATSSGPALFRQVRVGQAGRHFHILKLRTMTAGAAAMVGVGGDGPLRRVYVSNHFKVPAAADPR